MSKQSAFVQRIADEAAKYARDIAEAAATPSQVSEHDLALAILDAGDDQGWDRLTWTDDSDEYSASYGYDDEGNEFDPVPTGSALEFARFLLRRFAIVRQVGEPQ